MKCLSCGFGSKTIETRTVKNGWIRRRRECLSCLFRWFTIEVPQDDIQEE